VTLVVTRAPNFERLSKIELFAAPGNMVHVPAEELTAWLEARPGPWVVLEPRTELRHALPAGARVLGQTPRYVLYGR
jgi:hypothetical protein